MLQKTKRLQHKLRPYHTVVSVVDTVEYETLRYVMKSPYVSPEDTGRCSARARMFWNCCSSDLVFCLDSFSVSDVKVLIDSLCIVLVVSCIFLLLCTSFVYSVCTIYLSIYLKSQDYGDVGAEAQQGRLTM